MLENLIKHADGNILLKLFHITNDKIFKVHAQKYYGHPVFNLQDPCIILTDMIVTIGKGWLVCMDNYNNIIKMKLYNNILVIYYMKCKSLFHFCQMKKRIPHMFEEVILNDVSIQNRKNIAIDLPEISLKLSDACVYEKRSLNYITWNNS